VTQREQWGVRHSFQGRSSVTACWGRADAERWARQKRAPGETAQVVVRRVTTTDWTTVDVRERA
jgi:hypothetical protein